VADRHVYLSHGAETLTCSIQRHVILTGPDGLG
jgi:hypothetical protein